MPRCRDAVIRSRDRLSAGLQAHGFRVLPSAANFVLVTHPQHDAVWLAARLRERAIVVRHLAQPRIKQYLRISIGTDEECTALLHALDAILNDKGAHT